ncbi:hypothetical protein BU23DRAFT_562990 [Bimuria novae-zelandiae CBS 107.79]|uniref:Uncharacterized protein n=1 Tax=Bimuria novae-zelandiae CBS 107.79 TaxID=1447943 RepID=A0A6A5VSL1_9PLEO|nr:hypothetical protein BU23DRAFT_562990 [Bimuria novae-zelandiae CBS 107.79]
MLWRNVLGSATVLANTLINNIIFLTWRHSHKSEVCLLTCMTDIVWGMLVTNWLTMGSAESKDPSPPHKSNDLSDASTLVSAPTRQTPLTSWEKNWSSHTVDQRGAPLAGPSRITITPLDLRSLGVIPEPLDEDLDQTDPREV